MILETFEAPAEPGVHATPPAGSLDQMRTYADGLPPSMKPNAVAALDKVDKAIDRHPDGAVFRNRLGKVQDTGRVDMSVQRRGSIRNQGVAGFYDPPTSITDKTTMRTYMDYGRGVESADSVASTTLHEMTHMIDDQLGANREKYGIAATRTAGSEAAGKKAQLEARQISFRKDNPYHSNFEYAATDPHEALAEIVMMEVIGTPEFVWEGGYVTPALSPTEFRRTFPSLSDLARRWIRGEFDG